MKVLVTGTAGFIGFHLVEKLVKQDVEVVGLDAINDYYEISLKYDRLKAHGVNKDEIVQNQLIKSHRFDNYSFIKADLEDHDFVVDFMKGHRFDYVVNLAAQAGVRYSLTNPRAYMKANVDGFLSILEGARYSDVKHLVYASSSSVYGLNETIPFSERNGLAHPISLYAASKKANELMAHTYSHLYGVPTTGLRFFTVYGPWGRPDMALFIFTSKIVKNEPIEVFNNGNMQRDFTYVDDIVESISRLIPKAPETDESWDPQNPNPASSVAPYRILNIGNNSPVALMDFVKAIESKLDKKANIEFKPLQPGDVRATWADSSALEELVDYKPQTSITKGVGEFIDWYLGYYDIK